MKTKTLLPLAICVIASAVQAQLTVTVSPPKVAGQKAVIPLGLKNEFAEAVQSARAVAFLLDEHGKVLGQDTRWIIGGTPGRAGLPAGATNAFHFIIAGQKPFSTTNVTARVSVTRVVLDGGTVVDPAQAARIVEPPGPPRQPDQKQRPNGLKHQN